MGDTAARNGLRLGHDLLATTTRLATGGHFAGVSPRLLDRLGRAGLIDWSRCSLDAASLPAKAGGAATGPNLTDRGKPGSKRHLVVDRQGSPLAILLTAAPVHDGTVLEAVLDTVPPIRQPGGRRRPKKLHTDKAPLPPRVSEGSHRPADRAARGRQQRAAWPTALGSVEHTSRGSPVS